MFRNYLTIAIRNLIKQKLFSVINVLGLAIGLAFCILTFIYIRHEWTYDAFIKNADSIYRLYVGWEQRNGDQRFVATQSLPLTPVLAAHIPEIIHSVRLMTSKKWVSADEKTLQGDLLFAGTAFFDIFSYPLKYGNPKTALQDRHSVVLSAEMSGKLFGAGNPLGKRVSILRSGNTYHDFSVAGVALPIPENASIRFECLLPYERLTDVLGIDVHKWNTSYGGHTVYVQLADNARAVDIEAKFPSVLENHIPQSGRRWKRHTFHLQKLTDVHHATYVQYGPEPVSDPVYATILSGIAILVLIVACINFSNLSIGQSVTRSREVGVRKVMGARRTQIAAQIWGETAIVIALAVALGVATAELFLPRFSSLVQRNLPAAFLWDGWTWGVIVSLGFLVSLAAGGYPALYLSRFHPTDALRNTLRLGNKGFFGQSLVVVQYALSIFLIISAIFMFKQTRFLKTKSLSARGDQILVIPLHGQDRAKIMAVLQNELAQHRGVLEISGTSNLFGKGLARYTTTYRGEEVSFGVFSVYENYIDFMGIEWVSGRRFSETRDPNGVVVNETWLKTLGLGAAEVMKGVFKGRPIIGVVKDFHYRSLHRPIEPAMFSVTTKPSYLLIKIRPDGVSETIALVKDKWAQVVPNVPFDFAFLDDHIDRRYRSEMRWSKIIGYASVFAIFIASLGAFGLTALAVARRTKEIGIRKALGASTANISLLLSNTFTRRVILAILIAWPAAYYAMDLWLQNFAYRIDLDIGTFLAGSALAFLTALFSVGYLSIKAASANPVDALRYE